MSRKISEFFKLKPKSGDKSINNKERDGQCVTKDQSPEISTKLIKEEQHDEDNGSLDQEDCGLVSKNKSQRKLTESKSNKNVKIEPEQEFVIELSATSAVKASKPATKPQHYHPKYSNIPKFASLETKDECKYCHKLFANRAYLYDHVKRVHLSEIIDSLNECQYCDKKFFRKLWLTAHIKKYHADGTVKTYICDLDGRSFTKKIYLRSHMKQHFQKVKCGICDAELKVLCLSNHMTTVHGTDKNFQCHICNKSFIDRNHLATHAKIHDKKFECDICHKKYSHNRELVRHKKHFHEELKTVTCEICGKKFAEKGHLKQHSKVHDQNRPKPLKCEKCGHATDTMQRFRKHLRRHEREETRFAAIENPWKCNLCPKQYKNRSLLNVHRKKVHFGVTHQCDLCGKYCRNRGSLLDHIKSIHLKITRNRVGKDAAVAK